MQNRFAIYTIALIALFAPVLYPQIDIWISSSFYTTDGGFIFKDISAIKVLYKSVEILLYLLLAFIISGLTYQTFSKRNYKHFGKKELLYLLAVFTIGSGIIVNATLKEHMGRSRPRQIVQFGGDKQFVPALSPANECSHNCSFSCGHCSFAFGFLAFYFLFPRRWILITSAGYGILVSFARVVQGGHFFSDVVWSAAIMWISAWILHRLMYGSVASKKPIREI